jgi:cytochrome oxidase Cu insertion factor (SCO1/SenC/PrrC family)
MTPMSAPNPQPVARQRLTLIGLALLFVAPLGFAFYAYYGLHWHPGGRVNHGQLIDPPVPIPALSLQGVVGAPGTGEGSEPAGADLFKGKWTLLYRGPGACPATCRTELYDTRQVRAVLRQNDRLQRVFVAEGDCCDMEFLRTQHSDLITVRATREATPLLAQLALLERGSGQDAGASGPEATEAGAGRVYLVDPLGNLMMWYPPGAPPKGMLEDLKRLLGLSHVG